MSDEVKQAAERLRQFNAGTDPYPAEIGDDLVAFEDHDQAVLAAAYLAEHANDAENAMPLSAETLRSMLWFDNELRGETRYTAAGCEVCLRLENGKYIAFTIYNDDDGYGNYVDIGTIETVGDLRRLLEALHIPAAVVVPKGGE